MSLSGFTEEAARKAGSLLQRRFCPLHPRGSCLQKSLLFKKKRHFLKKDLCDLIVPLVALGLLGKSIYNARGNTASKTQALVGGHNQLLSQGSIFS